MILLAALACHRKVIQPPEVLSEPVPAPVAAPAPPPPALAGRAWESPLRQDHPLVGQIWSVSRAAPATWDELVADLRSVAYVSLGEKHDNPDHHRLQAELLAAATPKAVVFEQLDVADPIAGVTGSDALAAAVKWDESGWPDFAMYRPVFDATFASGAIIVGPHPTRDQVKATMADASYPIDSLSEPARAELGREIEESHCGMATPDLVAKMIRGQLYKDTAMAAAMIAAPQPVVLIAGTGHTRADRGVPAHLPPGTNRTVQMREVGESTDPADYDEGADWLVFTPRLDDDDPCAAFRK